MNITDKFYKLLSEANSENDIIELVSNNLRILSSEFIHRRFIEYISMRYNHIEFYKNIVSKLLSKNELSSEDYNLKYYLTRILKEINEWNYDKEYMIDITYDYDDFIVKYLTNKISRNDLKNHFKEVKEESIRDYSKTGTYIDSLDELIKQHQEYHKRLYNEIFINDNLDVLKEYLDKYAYVDELDAINEASYYKFFKGIAKNNIKRKSEVDELCLYTDICQLFNLLIFFNDYNCFRYYLDKEYDCFMDYRFLIYANDELFKIAEEYDRVDYIRVIKECIKNRTNYCRLEYSLDKLLEENDKKDVIKIIEKYLSKYNNKEASELIYSKLLLCEDL